MATPVPPKANAEFTTDLFRDFFKLDKPGDEWNLFWSRPSIENESSIRRWLAGLLVKNGWQNWIDRLNDWQSHLDIYDEIVKLSEQKKSPASTEEQTPESLAARSEIHRLTQLHSFLGILDSKIGMSLGFNSLLLGAVGVFLTWVPALLKNAPYPLFAVIFLFVFRLIAVGILATLLMSLWVLLLGFRRVVWGDLTKTKAETPSAMAKEYSLFLIISLTRRTNTFRISTYLTKYALIAVGAIIVMTMGVSLFAPFWDSHDKEPKGNVFIQVDSNNREIERESPPATGNNGVQNFGPAAPTQSNTDGSNPPPQGTKHRKKPKLPMEK